MLLFPRVTLLDLVGPHEFFAGLEDARLDLVEEAMAPVASGSGITLYLTAAYRGIEAFFMKGASVFDCESVTEAFPLVTLESSQFRGVHWTPGQKIQIGFGSGFVARTYTPSLTHEAQLSIHPALPRLPSIQAELRFVFDASARYRSADHAIDVQRHDGAGWTR